MEVPTQLLRKKIYVYLASMVFLGFCALLAVNFNPFDDHLVFVVITLLILIQTIDFTYLVYRIKNDLYGKNDREAWEIVRYTHRHHKE